MPHVPGLRSPYIKVGRIVYFGRMLDKIRLNAEGRLPAAYQANLGDTQPFFFDGRCCRFVGVRFSEIQARTLQARSRDEEILSWVQDRGIARTDEECDVWNRFMMKRGWRDDSSEGLQKRVEAYGMGGRRIETTFDLLDLDEGRDAVATSAWAFPAPKVIVVMGVAGSGKTTIGEQLASSLGWKFFDADEFHPIANIEKMSRGVPLTDEDRAPWLEAIRARMDTCEAKHDCAVFTCSALKQGYRETILRDWVQERLVYLKGDPALLRERISAREAHFMKPGLLESQLATLEEPSFAVVVDIAPEPAEIVRQIRTALGV